MNEGETRAALAAMPDDELAQHCAELEAAWRDAQAAAAAVADRLGALPAQQMKALAQLDAAQLQELQGQQAVLPVERIYAELAAERAYMAHCLARQELDGRARRAARAALAAAERELEAMQARVSDVETAAHKARVAADAWRPKLLRSKERVFILDGALKRLLGGAAAAVDAALDAAE